MNEPTKRRPGRPRNPVSTEPEKVPPKHKMKAKPNWEDIPEDMSEDTPDRLRVDRALIPEGMDLQWVTTTVYGQPVPQRRADFEKRGWTPVHQEDFDGQFDGMWMPKGAPGEITVDGLVLMARPLELTRRAKIRDKREADSRVHIKEAALMSGDIPGVTLDAQARSAVQSNRINKSFERIEIPKD